MTALILDCDGVLAETERYLHLPAFNQAFAELNVPVRWSEQEYGEKLRFAGGKERMATSLPALATDTLRSDSGRQSELLAQLHMRKTEIFEEMLRTARLPVRPGITRIIQAAKTAGWQVAIASTSSDKSVRAVVDHVLGPMLADDLSIFAGDIVDEKKPSPAIYQLAVTQLGVDSKDAIAIEDSRQGLIAACGAGLACVVTVSDYTIQQDFAEASLVLSSLGDPDNPAVLIANHTALSVGDYLTLDDLAAILDAGETRDHTPLTT